MRHLRELAAISILLISTALVGKVGARSNAYIDPTQLEPERVQPQAKIKLPTVETAPDAVDFFFEPGAYWSPQNGQPYPLVHMRIPKAPYFAKNSSSGPSRKYEIYIPMFYPNFSGLGDAENAECHADAMERANKRGFCRRQLIVGFGFAFMPSQSEELAYENLQNGLKKEYVRPAEEASKYAGLTLVAVQGYGESRANIYISNNNDGKPPYVIQCYEFAFSPLCKTTFRASKSPYIFISLDFVLPLLGNWKDLITATRNKVDSMIVKTYTLKSE